MDDQANNPFSIQLRHRSKRHPTRRDVNVSFNFASWIDQSGAALTPIPTNQLALSTLLSDRSTQRSISTSTPIPRSSSVLQKSVVDDRALPDQEPRFEDQDPSTLKESVPSVHLKRQSESNSLYPNRRDLESTSQVKKNKHDKSLSRSKLEYSSPNKIVQSSSQKHDHVDTELHTVKSTPKVSKLDRSVRRNLRKTLEAGTQLAVQKPENRNSASKETEHRHIPIQAETRNENSWDITSEKSNRNKDINFTPPVAFQDEDLESIVAPGNENDCLPKETDRNTKNKSSEFEKEHDIDENVQVLSVDSVEQTNELHERGCSRNDTVESGKNNHVNETAGCTKKINTQNDCSDPFHQDIDNIDNTKRLIGESMMKLVSNSACDTEQQQKTPTEENLDLMTPDVQIRINDEKAEASIYDVLDTETGSKNLSPNECDDLLPMTSNSSVHKKSKDDGDISMSVSHAVEPGTSHSKQHELSSIDKIPPELTPSNVGKFNKGAPTKHKISLGDVEHNTSYSNGIEPHLQQKKPKRTVGMTLEDELTIDASAMTFPKDSFPLPKQTGLKSHLEKETVGKCQSKEIRYYNGFERKRSASSVCDIDVVLQCIEDSAMDLKDAVNSVIDHTAINSFTRKMKRELHSMLDDHEKIHTKRKEVRKNESTLRSRQQDLKQLQDKEIKLRLAKRTVESKKSSQEKTDPYVKFLEDMLAFKY